MNVTHSEQDGCAVAVVKLKLLGQFEAWNGAGQSLIVNARKNRALLAALALAPSFAMPREYLAGLLWSDRGEAQARSSLRQALVALRKDLFRSSIDTSFLSVGGMKVAIDPTYAEIDVVEFQRLAMLGDVPALRRATELYRGDLLADTYIRDPVFEEWVASERQRLAEIAATVLEKLCAQETGSARIEVGRRLIALDPLRESSHRTLMRAYLELGENAVALRQYDICRNILRNELQVAPSEETEALRRQLQQSFTERPRSELTIVGGAAAHPTTAASASDKPVVVVRPFAHSGTDPEIGKLCNGLTEDIIAGLVRISAIRVHSRRASIPHSGHAADIGILARDWGVRYVVEGSVRTSVKGTRVTSQLIDAASGHHLWAQQIDRQHANNILDLQDEIAGSVVASVQTQIILNEGRARATDGAVDRVSSLLAHSWQRFLGLTEASLADCRALAERALELDGKNGMAHRMRAVALYHQIYMGFIPWAEETIDATYTHARISIESDGADEYSHWAMECAHLLRKQHELAAASLRRALEINPNCSLAYGSMGTVLAWSGAYDASVESNELALRLNPQDPANFFRHFGLSLAHYLAGRYDKAVAHARIAIQARPTWFLAGLTYAASLAQTERPEEAARILDYFRRTGAEMKAGSLTVLPFANAGDREHLEVGLLKTGLWERAENAPAAV